MTPATCEGSMNADVSTSVPSKKPVFMPPGHTSRTFEPGRSRAISTARLRARCALPACAVAYAASRSRTFQAELDETITSCTLCCPCAMRSHRIACRAVIGPVTCVRMIASISALEHSTNGLMSPCPATQ